MDLNGKNLHYFFLFYVLGELKKKQWKWRVKAQWDNILFKAWRWSDKIKKSLDIGNMKMCKYQEVHTNFEDLWKFSSGKNKLIKHIKDQDILLEDQATIQVNLRSYAPWMFFYHNSTYRWCIFMKTVANES